MIASMKQVMIVGPHELAREVIKSLQNLGTVHMIQSSHFKKYILAAEAHRELGVLEKNAAKIESILAILPKIQPRRTKPKEKLDDAWFNEISLKIQGVHLERQCLKDELTLLEAYRGAIRALSPLLDPLQGSKNFEALGFIIPKNDVMKLGPLEAELRKICPSDSMMIFKRSVNDDSLGIVIAFSKNKKDAIRPILNRYGLDELKFPASLSKLSFSDAVRSMDERYLSIPSRIQELDRQLMTISMENRSELIDLKCQYDDAFTSIRATKFLGETDKTFLIKGFNPSDNVQQLREEMNRLYGSRIYVEISETHDAPTLLKNHRLIRPFELFIKVLQPPKYGGIDPTPFFALFFPIFFGLIMGDMGYGLIFLSIGLILRLKTMHIVVKYLSEIIIICSVYTIFFGFIFGECFGDFFEKIGLLHPVKTTLGGLEIEWNRMHSLLPLLVLSIMIGVFHVTLGFLLKLLQAIKHKHRHEVIEVILILVSLGSIFLSIGSMSGMIAREMLWPVLMILLGSVAGLMYMKGPLMAMELLSFVGNMLSYARLMAVGVASAYLAFVGNMLGSLLGNVFFGVIVAVLFHIINMCLAFSPAIQSARLHYVEFFSKFYESGKISYQPLSRRQA